MGIAGWAPALTECARCATPGPHRAFHVAAGGSVCVHCRPLGSVTPPQGVLGLMSALHDGDWDAAELSPPPAEVTIDQVVGDRARMWIWYDTLGLPPAKSWWRNWRDVFPRPWR